MNDLQHKEDTDAFGEHNFFLFVRKGLTLTSFEELFCDVLLSCTVRCILIFSLGFDAVRTKGSTEAAALAAGKTKQIYLSKMYDAVSPPHSEMAPTSPGDKEQTL